MCVAQMMQNTTETTGYVCLRKGGGGGGQSSVHPKRNGGVPVLFAWVVRRTASTRRGLPPRHNNTGTTRRGKGRVCELRWGRPRKESHALARQGVAGPCHEGTHGPRVRSHSCCVWFVRCTRALKSTHTRTARDAGASFPGGVLDRTSFPFSNGASPPIGTTGCLRP